MPIKILMPALSPTMSEGNLVRWVKKEGDYINSGDVIAEIETDKANMEFESVDEGNLAKILVSGGTKNVKVNSVIGIISDENDNADDVKNFISNILIPKVDVQSNQNEIKNKNIVSKQNITKKREVLLNVQDKKRVFISPVAKRLANLYNVDLLNIVGTGPRGRIIKQDILRKNLLLKQNNKNIDNNSVTKIVASNMRKVIARKLLESKQNIPHFYLNIICIMDNLLKLRSDINANMKNDCKISINDFIILAVALTLKKVKHINVSWQENMIFLSNEINIAFAVSIDEGVITPVIKNVDCKKLLDISLEVKTLVAKVKKKQLSLVETQGAFFTISNLGMYGIKSFNAIINPPQAAILSVGQGIKSPVVVDDNICIRTVMNLNLSCDHRVIDGVAGAKFLSVLKEYIETPYLLFV